MRHLTRRFVFLGWIIASLLVVSLRETDVAAQESGRWYKGNLHTHSLWSDGNDFPEMIADWYAREGYHFLTLSDHNLLSRGEKWIPIGEPARRGAVMALERYRARFGDEWVETRQGEKGDEVRLRGLDEFRGKLEQPEKFLLIQAEEITDHFQSLPIHINATNLVEVIRPRGGASVREVIDANLRAVEEQSIAEGRRILAHLNHPNFGWGVTAEDLAFATRERFFEVFNGHPSVNQLGDADHPSMERFWDIANLLRLEHYRMPPLMGVATDDAHHYFGGQGATAGRGWVQVWASALDPEILLEAMERGNFYASSGVTVERLDWNESERTLTLELPAIAGVTYRTQFIGTDAAEGRRLVATYDPNQATRQWPESVGKVLLEVEGNRPSYQMNGSELYVRAVVISSRRPANPIWAEQVEQAWTQAFGWKVEAR